MKSISLVTAEAVCVGESDGCDACVCVCVNAHHLAGDGRGCVIYRCHKKVSMYKCMI